MKSDTGKIFAGAQVFQKACVFLVLFALAKFLGPLEFGQYSYFYICVTALAGVAAESISITAARFIALEKVEGCKEGLRHSVLYFLILSLVISSFVALAVMVVLILFSRASGNASVGVLVLISVPLMAMGLVMVSVTNSICAALSRHKVVAVYVVLNSFSLFLLAFLAFKSVELEVIFFVHALVIFFGGFSAICTLAIKESFHMKDFAQVMIFHKSYEENKQIWHYLREVLAGMLLAAPVHFLCLSILATSSDGIKQVGIFNAFFIFYTAISFLPSTLTVFIVSRLTGPARGQGFLGFRATDIKLVFYSLGSVLFALTIMLSLKDQVLMIMGGEYVRHSAIYFFAIIAGAITVLVITLNQINYSIGLSKYTFRGSVLYGVVYLAAVGLLKSFEVLAAGKMFLVISIAALLQSAYLIYSRVKYGRIE